MDYYDVAKIMTLKFNREYNSYHLLNAYFVTGITTALHMNCNFGFTIPWDRDHHLWAYYM
jgi:hypothetical protein